MTMKEAQSLSLSLSLFHMVRDDGKKEAKIREKQWREVGRFIFYASSAPDAFAAVALLPLASHDGYIDSVRSSKAAAC